MKIVLTGHRGFIGSRYLDYINNGNDVVTCDLVDGQDLCESVVADRLPEAEVVVHLAATNGTRLFYESPTMVAFNNTLPTFNLIKRYAGTKTKFVFASTCEIFNGAVDGGYYAVPTDEHVPAVFFDILNPRWSYSMPKALGENLVANSGLRWLVVRFFNIYGPGQKDHFISEFIDRVKKKEYYINGDDTRSFCYVDDAVKLFDRLIGRADNEIVNLGRQEEVKISEVARILMSLMGVDPDLLEIRPSPKGSAQRRCPDTSKLNELVGDFEYTELEVGLKLTLEALE